MKYIKYKFSKPFKGWMVIDTEAKHSDYCGNSFISAIRVWFWYMGMPAKKAFNLFRRERW